MNGFYLFLMLGIILIILEITTTTFYLLVIGVAFILASLFAFVVTNFIISSILAGIFAIIGCVLVSVYKKKANFNGKLVVNHVGQYVKVIDIDNINLQVLYSGSYWNAHLKHNNAQVKIGDMLIITKFTNNKLEVDVI